MRHAPRTRLEQALGRLDPRIVYLGLFFMTLLPLITNWRLPLYATEPVRQYHAAIEALPTDRLVMISSNWEAGSQAETRPQLIATARHLIRRNIRFVVIGIAAPASPQLAQTAVEEAIAAEGAQARWSYGTHWVNLGYKLAEDPWLRTFTQDIQDGVNTEWQGTPLSQIPVMQGIHDFGPDGQVSMLIDVTSHSSVEKWYQFITPTGVEMAIACTAVMAPEQYPFLDSGQISGLLTGMKGAAEYEQLLGIPGSARVAMAGQSFAHLYILILVVLGNLSLVAGRLDRRGRR